MDLASILSDNVTGIVVAVITGVIVYLLRSKGGTAAEPTEQVVGGLLGKLKNAASGSRLAMLSLLVTAWQERTTLVAAVKKLLEVAKNAVDKDPPKPPEQPA